MDATHTAWFRAGLVIGLVVMLDQLSKRIVESAISTGETERFLPGIDLVHTRNNGIAFSVSAGGRTVVVVVIAVAVVAILVYFLTHRRRPWLWLPTGLLLGGALGNLFDRLRDGAVTDFIKLPLWPAFNLADVAITVGVLALVYVLQADADRRPG